MKKFILILSLFLYGCSHVPQSNTNDLTCIQIIDRNGLSETISGKNRLDKFHNTDFNAPQPYKQVTRVFGKDASGKTQSTLTSYHPNGNIYQYLEVVDARAFGKYQEWHQNGTLKIQATVIGGHASLHPLSQKDWLFNGTCQAWDEMGNLISQISYNQGALHGKASYFYPNGVLKKEIPFIDNKIHGEVIKYHPSEKVYAKIQYNQDAKEGLAIGYWENNTICFEEKYENNFLISASYFSLNNEKLAEISQGKGQKANFHNNSLHKLIEYKEGLPEGLVQIFSPKNELHRTYSQKNNIKCGEEIEYFFKKDLFSSDERLFHKPLPKLSIFWEDDKIHGTIKTWYPNGKLESQREWRSNKKHGISSAWYITGEMMLFEEYEEDVLIKGFYYKVNDKIPVSSIVHGNGIATLYDKDGMFIHKIQYSKGVPQE